MFRLSQKHFTHPLFFNAFLACMLAFVMALLPTAASAATAQSIPPGPAVTLNTAGLYDLSTASAGATVTIGVNGIGLTGMAGNLAVVISAGITVTLVNASITSDFASPITAGGMNCGLILSGTNSATATGSDYAGVNVPDTASLTIDGPGALTAIGGNMGAGIGSDHDQSNGPITIQNATVVASSSDGGGAGIGGGRGGSGSQIMIINAAVTASGSGGGAGIGGGDAGAGSAITITDSAVTATGGSDLGGCGAGIGGGHSSSGSNITITNSQVLATGGAGGGGAGIGGGGGTYPDGSGGAGSAITLDAASTVRAVGGAGDDFSGNGSGSGGGAAIGGGGGGSGDSVAGMPAGTGGAASSIDLGGALAAGSAGGAGGASHNGGNGALAGSGGAGGVVGTPGANGTEVTLTSGGNANVGGATVDLSGFPNTSYSSGGVSYPAVPAVTDPSDASIAIGDNTSFSVAASGGTGTLAYQWQVSTDGGATWTDIAGETADTLSLSNVPLADDGNQYRCVVDDLAWREVTSGAAKLMVKGLNQGNTADVPTLNPWALALLVLAMGGVVIARRRRV